MSVKRRDRKKGYSGTERHNARMADTGLHFMRTENRNVSTAGGLKGQTQCRRGKGSVWRFVIRKRN